jgi:wyosine [tRNA(Phe)-imidazoG37] synthetase (radical SAM superfamily)
LRGAFWGFESQLEEKVDHARQRRETVRVFGSVPSRRLGRSLGVNNIPPKARTYSCIYCQVGRTTEMPVERRTSYDAGEILEDAQDKVKTAQKTEEPIDYLSFVPDGEPALDANLGREIDLLGELGLPTAVITNASLIWREDVREGLMKADWVSLKLDSAQEDVWQRVNRPHRALQLDPILEGILSFADAYSGELATEAILIEGIKAGREHVEEIAGFLARLKPSTDYLSIPTRPPAETWVKAPDKDNINQAYQTLDGELEQVEYLIGYEGNALAVTGDVEEDLLSITAVHPMREDAVSEFLLRAGADWSAVERLVAQRRLITTEYGGFTYYVRRSPSRQG